MITIHFDFKNRREEDLEQLNALLSTMKLESLDLEDLSGYLAVTKDAGGNLLQKRYGLDSGTLVCEQAAGSGGHTYQIDTVVADCSVDHDEYLNCWKAAHPGRAMRTVLIMGFTADNAFLITHHEKPRCADLQSESEAHFN